jgi:membrane protein DedA with SNARE-associated domain
MNYLIQVILPFLLLYKYWLLLLITFSSALILPTTPGTFIMISGGFASQGYFSIAWVFVVALVGNIAGDTICFWVARKYGAKILRKVGLGKIIDSKKTKHVERSLHVHAGKIIFLTRFESFSKLAVNIVTGLGNISQKKFFLPGSSETFCR